ncbi:hypothetical protein [Pseudomonas luteola]|uniref:hypothetical protein n=1 Tax=Pseudomonas luteola TaxID=47886 RepID=UPI00289AE8BD|nr:hypothetical protein [Pseudomonas luteola]
MNQPNTKAPKKYATAWLFVYLSSFNICIAFVIFAVLFMAFRSFPLGVAMLCTGLGFLLVNSGFSDNKKVALGLLLAVVGYSICLPGTFKPVNEVIIRPYAVGFGGKTVAVTVDADNCSYELRTSRLTCDAQVLQAGK